MSEDQNLVRDMADSLFKEYCSNQVVLDASEGRWPGELWQALEDSGLPLMAVPDEYGGSGASLTDAFTVLQVAGSYSAPVPLAETIMAGWVLSSAGVSVPSGPLTVAPVVHNDQISIELHGNGATINGSVQRVPWARDAAMIVLIDQNRRVITVEPGAGRLVEGRNLAGEPRDTLEFNNVSVQPGHVIEAHEQVCPDALRIMGALTRTALIAGALERALDLSVEYVINRQQFGRPLTRFQAIQQYLAQMAAEVAAVGAATRAAVARVEKAWAAGESLTGVAGEVAAAKIRAGEAAGKVARIAHQVHGAIGFTYDHQLHLTTRRLWSWRDEFGSESYWAIRLGDAVFEAGAESLWPMLTS